MTGNFIEIPSSVTIEVENGVEMDAVFRCHHERLDAQIGWLINGSISVLYRDVVDGFTRDSNGTHVETLTIPAIPEYNGTEVVCVATFFDGSPHEVTPPAYLIFRGMHAIARPGFTQLHLVITIIIQVGIFSMPIANSLGRIFRRISPVYILMKKKAKSDLFSRGIFSPPPPPPKLDETLHSLIIIITIKFQVFISTELHKIKTRLSMLDT